MLLYIHVPFCVRKCGYCAFHSGLYAADDASRYVKLVIAEMAVRAAQYGRRTFETVYFGGGTPSLLELSQIGAILDGVSRYFGIASGAEITLEANPESAVRQGFLAGLQGLGVNRLSLGAQSFKDEALFLLGRPHRSRDTMKAVNMARSAGIANVSLDLIWGVPGQSPKDWLDDLKAASGLRPEHLSCYGLTLEEGTPLARQFEDGEFVLPDEDDTASMYMLGSEYLESEGYLQYEVSNYARMGFQSRHNSGYWSQEEYLGLGPAAVSTVDDIRWTNPKDLRSYEEACGKQTELETLDSRTRWQEMVMLSLRTSKGLHLEEFLRVTGTDFFRTNRKLVQMLRTHRLVRLQAGYLRLTRNGMLVSNSIIERLIDGAESMHSDTTGNL